ncbi:unnamed protein product [Caenorhabditis angaria]|uniref:E3 ubiquitin-protein ligase E3D n=1 Tax=Caenorhabditis angaria TaxID=860376 RepID=A0A9P1N3H7_9PELO|nr:unnamed protein product [Caenorhabditis angaria]
MSSLVSQLDSFGEWTDFSVFIEMKPRSDLASLFVDVPPGFREKEEQKSGGDEGGSGDAEKKKIKYEDINVINVTETKICIGAPPSAETLHKNHKEAVQKSNNNAAQSKPVAINNKKNRERSTSGSDKGSSSCSPKSGPTTPTKKSGKKKNGTSTTPVVKFDRYGVTLKNATINTKSLSSPTWSDASPRLFMCKVQIEPDNLPLVQKTLHRLAVDICKIEKLEEFAQRGNPRLKCSKCQMELLSDEYIMTIGCLPDDDWLTTSQSADFYCRDSCGAACDPNRHNHANNSNVENRADSKWLPHEKRIMISFANTVAHKTSIIPDSIIVDDKFLICAGCKSQLGRVQKNHADLYSFNHISATLTSGIPKKLQFIEKDFFSQSVYLSQLILNSCEAQGSLKLVLRSLDKTPYMLIWLLDSYVVIANGEMDGLKNEEESGNYLTPYPSIKLLYKVFNDQTAGSDPRANGEDTSVGLVDLPLGCCQYLIEMLLRSSLKLPPACRAVGQFFVGFLQIDDHI